MVLLLRRLGEALARPRARWLPSIAAMVLTSASLGNGLVFDDALHRLKVHGAFGGSLATRLDLFTFVPADPAARAHLAEIGFLPWFASPDLRLAFLRPVASLLAFADYTFLDRWPWAMHLESVVLYGAIAALLVAFYRRFLTPAIAVLAALLYAIDDGHGLPVGWVANRNSLLATFFALAALWAHDRWRRDRWTAGAALGPLAFALALGSAELALGAAGFFVAYALVIDPATTKLRRAATLAPYAIVVALWQAVYRAGGYGARGSGLYLDPIVSPLAFARALPMRAVLLLNGLFAAPSADVGFLAPLPVRVATVIVAIVLLVWIARAVRPLVMQSPALRFFALGALLAIVPGATTVPSDRLLLLAGFGGFAIIATTLGDLRAWGATRERLALRRTWIAIHLLGAPLALVATSLVPRFFVDAIARATGGLHLGPELAAQTLVVTNVPYVLAAYPLMFPLDDDASPPRRLRVLVSTQGPVQVRRDDARTLTVIADPRDTADPILGLFRDGKTPAYEGETFDVPGMQVVLHDLNEAREPGEIEYRFDEDLDARSVRFLAWDGGRFVDYVAPRVGGRDVVGR